MVQKVTRCESQQGLEITTLISAYIQKHLVEQQQRELVESKLAASASQDDLSGVRFTFSPYCYSIAHFLFLFHCSTEKFIFSRSKERENEKKAESAFFNTSNYYYLLISDYYYLLISDLFS